ncbi:MAG: hypothetical protein WCZ29_03150 [Mycolicibacterium vanbaalenii]|uniref:hypothetical protein n=1 Tax=Mycolicibacterium vanbaalenii TaxID=110539 RepID=UPI00356196C3
MPTTDGAELCRFCRTYVPPTRSPEPVDHLDAAVARIDSIRADINAVIRALPDDVPMFALVDIVNALWNLRNASVLLDKANAALEVDAQVMQR